MWVGLWQSEQVILNTNIKSPSAEMFGADVCDCFSFLAPTPGWCQKCVQCWPWPSPSCWKCCEEKKAFAHTDWMIDFIWSVCWAQAWLCWCVMSVSMVKNTGHARLWAVQGVKKKRRRKACARTGGRGGGGKFESKNSEGVDSWWGWRDRSKVYLQQTEKQQQRSCSAVAVFQLHLLWTTTASQDFWTLSANWSSQLYVVRYSTNKDGESGSYFCPHWSWAAMQEASVYNEPSMNTITIWRISIIICLIYANRWREKVGGFDFFSK